MSRLKEFWSGHERVWVTDLKTDTESLKSSGEVVRWLPYQAPRDWQSFLHNLPQVYRILRQEQPAVIVSTGASIAVGFAICAKLLGIRFVYVESISRSQEISLTGKLVYLLSHEFYVQDPELCQRYSKAQFKGYVV